MQEHNLFQIFVSRINKLSIQKKHLRDIAGILALSSDRINLKILEEKIKEGLLEKEWVIAKKFKI